jgi:phosphate uptake regulator
MIKELLAVFNSDSLMDRAYKRSFDMLGKTKLMFIEAKQVLRNTEHNELNIDIDDEDIEINRYQREVRKDVLKHLAVTGVDELASGLVLITIVIDLERIGDYTKNIVEIAKNYQPKLFAGEFEDELKKIEIAVEENFDKTLEVFREANEEKGRELLAEQKWISKQSDQIIKTLVRSELPFFSNSNVAALVLYVRSLKRIYSHLRNITTSVVNPFHRIGYKPKKESE